MINKRGQLTIFIILAIAIVAVVGVYFIFKEGVFIGSVPQEFEPVYSYYLSCIKDSVSEGALILGQQGGYIETPEFSPGSEFMPFSSHLDFLGIGVPYWYYISGNNIAKEQKPSIEKMQSQLNDFLKQRIIECDFSGFNQKGFEISLDNAEVYSSIKDNLISVNVKQNLEIKFENSSWSGKNHIVNVNSNLGKFYSLADKIYSNNKETMFLENYGLDVLRLYAPVDGSEIGCSSKIWQIDDIRNDLMNALETNVPFTKIQGDYYSLSKKENKYFVRDIGTNADVNVNFMYSKSWPLKLKIDPSENGILKADPVGLQEGLGMLGFCYVPYHFVYDFAYPVLIQIFNDKEIFQFPVVISINKNNPREALNAEGLPDAVPELCKNKNVKMKIYTYDNGMNPVEADIKFKCFETSCDIGKTASNGKDAVLEDNFPQCINGFILAEAEGFETGKYQIPNLEENSASITLNKKYKFDLEIQKSGNKIGDYAVITFTKDNKANTLAYPEQKEIELSEGQYQIKVYIYSNSSINLKGSKSEKCVDIPKTGILGALGQTEKKCFTLEIPDQIVSSAVSGGGVQNYYAGEGELKDSKKLIINANDFGIPTKLEDLQINYNKIDSSDLEVRFE